jgi:hypothetical protein
VPSASPHTRGSSPPRRLREGPTQVFPARAGVIPWPWRRRRSRCRLPRACGGSSLQRVHARHHRPVFPRVRGSSPVHDGAAFERVVLPVRAGVIPARLAGCRGPCRPPRMRRGHPSVSKSIFLPRASSPHARESSQPPRRVGVRRYVLPAHAGVVRCARRACRGRGPHSPRVRGSSEVAVLVVDQVTVLITRAGAIPAAACAPHIGRNPSRACGGIRHTPGLCDVRRDSPAAVGPSGPVIVGRRGVPHSLPQGHARHPDTTRRPPGPWDAPRRRGADRCGEWRRGHRTRANVGMPGAIGNPGPADRCAGHWEHGPDRG